MLYFHNDLHYFYFSLLQKCHIIEDELSILVVDLFIDVNVLILGISILNNIKEVKCVLIVKVSVLHHLFLKLLWN